MGASLKCLVVRCGTICLGGSDRRAPDRRGRPLTSGASSCHYPAARGCGRISAVLLHFAMPVARSGVAIPPTGKEPRNFGLGRFHQTTTRSRSRGPGTRCRPPRSSRRRSARTCLNDPVCLMSPTWPRSQPASAVSLRIPRRHVPDADSDRARLPGTGPAPRLGRRRTCRAKG